MYNTIQSEMQQHFSANIKPLTKLFFQSKKILLTTKRTQQSKNCTKIAAFYGTFCSDAVYWAALFSLYVLNKFGTNWTKTFVYWTHQEHQKNCQPPNFDIWFHKNRSHSKSHIKTVFVCWHENNPCYRGKKHGTPPRAAYFVGQLQGLYT